MRGFIAHDWQCLQYKYFLKLKTKDVHAVDKWARMVIKQLLELHRVMWKNRCDLIAQDNIQSYGGRQRQELTSLCTYLQANPNELLDKDVHYLDRSLDFFSKTPLDNLLMWQKQILACLATKDPEIVIRPATKENTIKRHFRTVQKKKKRGRPKKTKQKPKKRKKKSQQGAPSAAITPKKKRKIIQSPLTRYFELPQQQLDSDTESVDSQVDTLPENPPIQINDRSKRQKIDE